MPFMEMPPTRDSWGSMASARSRASITFHGPIPELQQQNDRAVTPKNWKIDTAPSLDYDWPNFEISMEIWWRLHRLQGVPEQLLWLKVCQDTLAKHLYARNQMMAKLNAGETLTLDAFFELTKSNARHTRHYLASTAQRKFDELEQGTAKLHEHFEHFQNVVMELENYRSITQHTAFDKLLASLAITPQERFVVAGSCANNRTAQTLMTRSIELFGEDYAGTAGAPKSANDNIDVSDKVYWQGGEDVNDDEEYSREEEDEPDAEEDWQEEGADHQEELWPEADGTYAVDYWHGHNAGEDPWDEKADGEKEWHPENDADASWQDEDAAHGDDHWEEGNDDEADWQEGHDVYDENYWEQGWQEGNDVYWGEGADDNQGVCYRCGSAEHYVRDCPHPPHVYAAATEIPTVDSLFQRLETFLSRAEAANSPSPSAARVYHTSAAADAESRLSVETAQSELLVHTGNCVHIKRGSSKEF